MSEQMVTVTNTTYINSSVIELLGELLLPHPDQVVLDNAAYQRCFWVQAYKSIED